VAKKKKKDGKSRAKRKMLRRRMPPGRCLLPDARFGSTLVSRFINCLMLDGKKTTAARIFNEAMDIVKEKLPEADPLEVFTKALDNCKPVVEVKSRRVGGANYQVPIEVKAHRQQALAIRWMIDYMRARGERTSKQRLANEILDAYNNTGGAVKKKEDTLKMAEANKAFAHYRW
jgi:small subunit ribosomal protein S7